MGPQILVFSMNPMGYPILTPSWWWIWRWLLIFWKVTTWGIPKRGSLIFGGKTLSGSQILGQRMSLKMEPMILTVPKKRVKSTTVEPLHVESLLVDAATFRLWRCCNCCNKNTLGSVGSIRSWEIPELHGTLGKTRGKYGKIPEPNEGFVGKVIYNWRVFQPAMLDHQRVSHKKWEFHQQEFWLGFGIYNWASARFEVC